MRRVCKNCAIAPQFRRDDDDGSDHHDVEHEVLDNRDGGGRPQAAGIGVSGEDGEGRDQRPLALDTQRGNHLADTNQLQRDVRHGCQNSGDGEGDGKPAAAIAAAHIIGKGYVTLAVTYRPELGQHQHHQRVGEDGVWYREKAEGPAAVERRRHGDHRISGVAVAADQEPDDERAKAATRESPLFQAVQVRTPPARREEAGRRHDQEAEAEDDECRGVDRRWHRVRLYDARVLYLPRTLSTLNAVEPWMASVNSATR